MAIWKCAGGGYRSGGTEYEEYCARRMRDHERRPDLYTPPVSEEDYREARGSKNRDIQLVRLPDVVTVFENMNRWERERFDELDEIQIVLNVLQRMTPDGKDKKAWKEIHNEA